MLVNRLSDTKADEYEIVATAVLGLIKNEFSRFHKVLDS